MLAVFLFIVCDLNSRCFVIITQISVCEIILKLVF